MKTSRYPVRIEARLDEDLSRWLWLVKWVLVIPHYVVLAGLWLAFGVVTVIAFFAILFTERYPRRLFDFNVGVLRWSWRVSYYAYSGLGTDRYPPFTLAEVPEYPATLQVEYPAQLSRGLVLVKWWLLAFPQYLVVGVLAGGVSAPAWLGRTSIGLIALLVLVAAFGLAFTGRYSRPLFDFVMGLNRWVWRVVAYASLLTDSYPPFRLDLGGEEPDANLAAVGPDAPPAPDASRQTPSTTGGSR